MDKVHIVNWILTRKCNLSCEYCRIASDYERPVEYPPLSQYHKMEMDTPTVIEYLKRFHKHNPNCFHIFYGGEPLLRDDLPEIVKFCHDNGIFYTIITNNSEAVQSRIVKLFEKVGYLEGLTSSIDPVIFDKNASGDIVKKSLAGLEKLYQYRDKVKDLVAEVTVDKNNIKYLKPLIQELTNRGICSSITFIDIAKNNYYDFSNVTDKSILVGQEEAIDHLMGIINLNVHMGEMLLSKIYNILPSDLDCEIERSIHNLTIDADAAIRLCLRIRGVETPRMTSSIFALDESGNLDPELISYIDKDKKKYCEKCNWSCMCMSKSLQDGVDSKLLTHEEKRKE